MDIFEIEIHMRQASTLKEPLPVLPSHTPIYPKREEMSFLSDSSNPQKGNRTEATVK